MARRRLFVQAAWTALCNVYLAGFVKGTISAGPLKNVCVPGLNCYSCPGALGACPVGSFQAMLTGMEPRFPLYVLGFLFSFGALFGRFVCGWLCRSDWCRTFCTRSLSAASGAICPATAFCGD